jgi:hypothetical protein
LDVFPSAAADNDMVLHAVTGDGAIRELVAVLGPYALNITPAAIFTVLRPPAHD